MDPYETPEPSSEIGNFNKIYDEYADITEQINTILEEQTDKPLNLEEKNKFIKDLRTKLQRFKADLDSLIEESNYCGIKTKEFGRLYDKIQDEFRKDPWLKNTYKDIAQFVDITNNRFAMQTEIHRKMGQLLTAIPPIIRFINNFAPENQPTEPIQNKQEASSSTNTQMTETQTNQPHPLTMEEEIEEKTTEQLAHEFFTAILKMYEGEKNVHEKWVVVLNANKHIWSKLTKLFNKYPEEKEGFKKLWNECKLPVQPMAGTPWPSKLLKEEKEKIEMILKRLEDLPK